MTSQYEVFGETLKGKLLEDILELKDIKALDYYMTRIITDNFREPYVRLLVSKLPTLEEQTEYVEWIYEEINRDDAMPWCEQSYLVYLLDLRLQLKGKRKELEPSPQVLGAAYAAKLLKEDIIGICGEWVLVDDDFSAFAYNWVEGYRYNPYPWEWKDKLRDVWEQEWCDMNIFDDLMRMIANNTATMYINEKEVDEVIKDRVENVLFSELKAPTEPHANKRKFIIDSFAKYFDAPSLPQPEEAAAELQSRCDTLTAENTELRLRCKALDAEIETLNANRPSRSSALTDALKSFFKDENEDVETFLNTIEGKDGEEVTDFVRSVYRAGRIKDKMHSGPLYYTLFSHGYYTKSKQNWDQQLAKK